MLLEHFSDFYRTLLTMSIGAFMMAASSVIKVHITDHPIYNKVRAARNLLVLTYFVVICFNIAELSLPQGNQLIHAFFIISGMYESLFMIFFLVTLINPELWKMLWLWQHSTIILFFLIFNIVTDFYFPEWFQTIYYVTLVFYGCLLAYYTKFFYKIYYQTLEYLKEYYEEDEEIHIKWIRNSFLGLFFVAVLTIVATFTNYYFYSLYIIFYVMVYSYIAIGFINRYYKYSKLIPTVVEITKKQNHSSPDRNRQNTNEGYNKARLPMTLDLWITEKGYLKANVPMEEILKILDTTKPVLTSFMLETYGIDFHTWRNELRLEYAYNLLTQHPELSVEMVAKEVGFNEPRYFVNAFKRKYNIHPKDLLDDPTALEDE